jgi:hypothetical protein
MVYPRALLGHHALRLLFFIRLLKQLPQSLLYLVAFVLLGIGRWINVELFTDFSLQRRHVLRHLVQVLGSKLHQAVKAPVDVRKDVTKVKDKINHFGLRTSNV